MGEGEKLSGKNFFWYVLSVLLVVIVFYAIYRGMVVNKMNISGVMEIEFKKGDDGLENVKQAAQLDSTEREIKQQQLLEKNREYVQQVDNVPAYSDNHVTDHPTTAQIGGNWTTSEGVSYVITQFGSNISLQEFNPLYGITATGTGHISGKEVTINYETIVGTTGSLHFTLSPDGSLLNGQYQDHTSGATGRIQIGRMQD